MTKFMFILMLLMAFVMAWWIIPVAIIIWGIVRHMHSAEAKVKAAMADVGKASKAQEQT